MDPLNLPYFVTCYIQLKRSRSHRTAIRVEGPGNETRPQSALTSVYGIAYLKIPVLRLADLPDPQPFSFSPSDFSKWARASWIIHINVSMYYAWRAWRVWKRDQRAAISRFSKAV